MFMNYYIAWNKAKPYVMKALEEYPEYQLVLTGHSLGGSVACLMNLLIFTSITGPSTSTTTSSPEATEVPEETMTTTKTSPPPLPTIKNAITTSTIGYVKPDASRTLRHPVTIVTMTAATMTLTNTNMNKTTIMHIQQQLLPS